MTESDVKTSTSIEARVGSNFEVEWDHLQNLIRTPNPLHDLVTDIIDDLSPDERERIRNSIGYKNVFCKLYMDSRAEWINTAQKFKGRELTMDEVIALANKHRIYYAVTHPRGMNIHPHNPQEEHSTCEFLRTLFTALGDERCREIGYCLFV